MVTDDSSKAALVLPQTPALKTLSVADGKSSTRQIRRGERPDQALEVRTLCVCKRGWPQRLLSVIFTITRERDRVGTMIPISPRSKLRLEEVKCQGHTGHWGRAEAMAYCLISHWCP